MEGLSRRTLCNPLSESRLPSMKYLFYATAVIAIAAPVAMGTRALAQTRSAKVSEANRAVAHQAETNQALIGKYCVGCHSAKLKTGGLALEGLDLKVAENNAAIWEKVL